MQATFDERLNRLQRQQYDMLGELQRHFAARMRVCIWWARLHGWSETRHRELERLADLSGLMLDYSVEISPPAEHCVTG